jgi:ubiquitin C
LLRFGGDLQISVETSTGSNITFAVDPNDATENIRVKAKFQDQEGVPSMEISVKTPKGKTFTLEVEPANSSENAKDPEVEAANSTEKAEAKEMRRIFFPDLEEMRSICIKTSTRGKLIFDVKPSDTIETIKKKIEEKEGIPHQIQRLSYHGRQLEDGRPISDYNIDYFDVIKLLYGPLGPGKK